MTRKRVLMSVVIVALIIFLVVISGFVVQQQQTSSTSFQTTSSSYTSKTTCIGGTCSGNGLDPYHYIVDLFAVDTYGNWIAGNETPESVLQIVHELRSSVSDKPISVFNIVKNIQINTETLDNTSMTLDNFLVQLKQIAGGDVVPELNLDAYLNALGRYCDPRNPSFCGPAFFYKTSLELLSLTAVQEGNKTVLLDSWPTFYRTAPATIQAAVLQNLTNEGWQHIIIKQIGPGFYPDPGNTWGQITTPWKNVTSSPPYMQPQTNLLSQMPSSQEHFLYFDRQDKNNPSPNAETALQSFLSDFNSSAQASILTNLASLQPIDGYVFDYPVLTFTMYNGVTYSWDASTSLQTNGQPFLQLIEHLMNTTNSHP